MKLSRRAFLQLFGAAVGVAAAPQLAALASPVTDAASPGVKNFLIQAENAAVDLSGGIDWGGIISVTARSQLLTAYRLPGRMDRHDELHALRELDVVTYLSTPDAYRHLADAFHAQEPVIFAPPALKTLQLQPVRCLIRSFGMMHDYDQGIRAQVELHTTDAPTLTYRDADHDWVGYPEFTLAKGDKR